ncbi:dienelactone hydrolase family protein [Archangium primigenium]|uniref:dienelactone hydrolase family protein n=1 Tax=[Archangium] primigenium TaxID=2792470 RepID=UPI00195B471F|nr:dienelactone hydrolase family protein [Archangium primigenium]MBM7112016.1 dienelactone hydrolase family protein [Archangium primigenium]
MKTLTRVSRMMLAAASLFASAAGAQSATLVTFPGDPSDSTLEGGQLSGVLYKPAHYATSTSLRAVVLLHGCSGYWSNRTVGATNANGTPNLQNQVEKWGLTLASQGIVALAVDSYTRRKPSTAPSASWQDQCAGKTYAGRVDPYTTRVRDAERAHAWLAADSHIDATRIGILGWSQGAQAALVETAEQVSNTPFRTTVLFYPGCGAALGFGTPGASTWRPHHDLRFNIGDADGFHGDCAARATTALTTYGSTAGSGHELVFVSYADAGHGFDGESQAWNPSCTTPDECAMVSADVASLSFLLSRL